MATEHPLMPGQLRGAVREGPETFQQGHSMSGTAKEDVPGMLLLLSLFRLICLKSKNSQPDDHSIHTESTPGCTSYTSAGCDAELAPMQSAVQTRQLGQGIRPMGQRLQQQQITGLSRLQRQTECQLQQQAELRPMETTTPLKLLKKQTRSC